MRGLETTGRVHRICSSYFCYVFPFFPSQEFPLQRRDLYGTTNELCVIKNKINEIVCVRGPRCCCHHHHHCHDHGQASLTRRDATGRCSPWSYYR